MNNRSCAAWPGRGNARGHRHSPAPSSHRHCSAPASPGVDQGEPEIWSLRNGRSSAQLRRSNRRDRARRRRARKENLVDRVDRADDVLFEREGEIAGLLEHAPFGGIALLPELQPDAAPDECVPAQASNATSTAATHRPCHAARAVRRFTRPPAWRPSHACNARSDIGRPELPALPDWQPAAHSLSAMPRSRSPRPPPKPQLPRQGDRGAG